MQRRTLLAAPIALAATRALAADKIRIVWWHSMTAALGDEVARIATGFNASQDAVELEAVYKGGYADSLNAVIAASRAGQAPHLPRHWQKRLKIFVERFHRNVFRPRRGSAIPSRRQVIASRQSPA